ncbi:MAG: hypothetical protein A2138_25225 [Deltaproteobacteria bacterium RBG_16_71_12]|nr:MAG: hypothetical protein A2138_25225 [Deltaproteobacteria bacterium RBG_16_71_12]
MIIPDVNVLMHAYRSASPLHAVAARFWSVALNGDQAVALSWVVINGYVRLMTNPRVVAPAIHVAAAEHDVRSWLQRRNVVVVHPTEQHADLYFGFLRSAGTAGNLTTDAHIAALAVEHDAEVVSADTDFARFAGVRWTNPFAP